MIKHVILWKLKDEYTNEQKIEIKNNIKKEIEALKGVVSEIVDIRVYINGLETSSADLMLDSTFNSAQDLKAYAVHPAHVDVANRIVRPYVSERSCLDFEI